MKGSRNADVRGALLVGSVPLENSAAVFIFASENLGDRLRRIPDGETGVRTNWTLWQLDVFGGMPALVSEIFDTGYLKRPKFRLRRGATAEEVKFPPLGYAREAIASYATFRALKAAGTIRRDVKFQVCLPTPLAVSTIFVFPEDQAKLEPLYEAAMLAEVDAIVATIPSEDLALQWDTAVEFAILEGLFPNALADPYRDIIERLTQLGNKVSSGVELGFHLCYGDSGGRHFKEPDDTSKLVSVANAVTDGLTRPLDWLHLPVPKERSDPDYYRALEGLRLNRETDLFLGLVHADDGSEGTRRRIAIALNHVSTFGVAAECGYGRRKPDALKELMRIHREVSLPIVN